MRLTVRGKARSKVDLNFVVVARGAKVDLDFIVVARRKMQTKFDLDFVVAHRKARSKVGI